MLKVIRRLELPVEHVLISGGKAPIIGLICMDQMMDDITNIANVACGDIAVLIGKFGDLRHI